MGNPKVNPQKIRSINKSQLTAMPHPVDTKNPTAVAKYVCERFKNMYPEAKLDFLNQLLSDVTNIFTGKHPDFQANDLKYHDFEHTLQATVCLVTLLASRHATDAEPRLSYRNTELAIASALLHDSGYQMSRSVKTGTGAQFTFMHVLRSCAFAATYLPTINVTLKEIHTVIEAIQCTGPTSMISQRHFANPVEHIIGCALSTSDYLGQMAAADYPDELEFLYAEFEESYNYYNVPADERLFASAEALKKNTGAFWLNIVRPKLEKDFLSIYRFLSAPYPDGPNPYIIAVGKNLAEIQKRLARNPAEIN